MTWDIMPTKSKSDAIRDVEQLPGHDSTWVTRIWKQGSLLDTIATRSWRYCDGRLVLLAIMPDGGRVELGWTIDDRGSAASSPVAWDGGFEGVLHGVHHGRYEGARIHVSRRDAAQLPEGFPRAG